MNRHGLVGRFLPEDGDPAGVKVGIETDRGPLVAALAACGYQVYAVNPLQSARARQGRDVSGAKSDAGDAHVLADLVRTRSHQLRTVAGDSEQAGATKVLAWMRQSLIWDRTRLRGAFVSLGWSWHPEAAGHQKHRIYCSSRGDPRGGLSGMDQQPDWTEVFGLDYPAELEPSRYIPGQGSRPSWIISTCRAARHWLMSHAEGGTRAVGSGHEWGLVAGCGHLADRVGEAAHRAIAFGLGGRARFMVGSFDAIPTGSAAAAGLMSIDSLLFAPTQDAAVKQCSRVLRPGSRLVATTWDYKSQPTDRPAQLAVHRPLLADHGFWVLVFEETTDSEENQRRLDELLLASLEELAAESGEDADELRQGVLEMAATVETMLRRVLIVAQKR